MKKDKDNETTDGLEDMLESLAEKIAIEIGKKPSEVRGEVQEKLEVFNKCSEVGKIFDGQSFGLISTSVAMFLVTILQSVLESGAMKVEDCVRFLDDLSKRTKLTFLEIANKSSEEDTVH